MCSDLSNTKSKHNKEVLPPIAPKLHRCIHVDELFPPLSLRGHGVKSKGHRGPKQQILTLAIKLKCFHQKLTNFTCSP